MNKRRLIKATLICAAAVALCAIALFLLVWNGIILLNNPSREKYPVRGVDVSSYQGEIDWGTLAAENISFAFIKATEGSSFVDQNFAYNYSCARKTELAVGAYHFFSFDSSGTTQAENFINTVEPFDGMLPPVIDLEFYGDKEKNPPARADVETELGVMLTKLEEHYGMKPIIYATEISYDMYLSGGYDEYDIWIRDVITKPTMSDGRKWTFWQYTNRERLGGYNGEERFIDMNVFYGSQDEFKNYISNN